MSKKRSLIIIAVITVTLLFAININPGEKTLEEAMLGSEPQLIIHNEETETGNIVFSTDLKKDALFVDVISKGMLGYENLYSGVETGIGTILKKNKISYNYLPAIKGTSLPIYCGIVGNSDIEYMEVKNESTSKKAKIVDTNDIRIWIVFMEGFNGSDFNIIGYSSDNTELVKITDNISPWSAEDKPVKSPYK